MAVYSGLSSVRNPVFWQEVTHQERGMRHWRKRWRWIGYVLVGGLIGFVASTLQDPTYGTRETGMLAIWIVHTCAAIFSIVAGANVISREHASVTWDSLVLTGVSARKIMFGKWKAALRRAGGWMVLLGMIRLAMIPVFTFALLNRFAYFYGSGYYSSRSYYDETVIPTVEIVPWAVLAAVGFTVLLTALEILSCTALGMATSAVTRRGAWSIISAITIRFAPVIIFAGYTAHDLGGNSYRVWRWWRSTTFAIADGGTSPLYYLSMPSIVWTRNRQPEALPGLFLAMGSLLLILVISLIVAWWAIRRSGALPAGKASETITPVNGFHRVMGTAGD